MGRVPEQFGCERAQLTASNNLSSVHVSVTLEMRPRETRLTRIEERF